MYPRKECGLGIATVKERALSCISQEPERLLHVWERQAVTYRKREGMREPDGWVTPVLFPEEAGAGKEKSGGWKEKWALGRSLHALGLYCSLSHQPPFLLWASFSSYQTAQLPLPHHLIHHSCNFPTPVRNRSISIAYACACWGTGAETFPPLSSVSSCCLALPSQSATFFMSHVAALAQLKRVWGAAVACGGHGDSYWLSSQDRQGIPHKQMLVTPACECYSGHHHCHEASMSVLHTGTVHDWCNAQGLMQWWVFPHRHSPPSLYWAGGQFLMSALHFKSLVYETGGKPWDSRLRLTPGRELTHFHGW